MAGMAPGSQSAEKGRDFTFLGDAYPSFQATAQAAHFNVIGGRNKCDHIVRSGFYQDGLGQLFRGDFRSLNSAGGGQGLFMPDHPVAGFPLSKIACESL